jgi:hypothetical protein
MRPDLGKDLEQRRLAVAQALRAVSVEPAPSVLSQRVRDLERQLAAVRMQVTHALSRVEVEPPAETAADTPDEELVDMSVPPLESVGLMSPVASRALFGA